MSCHSFPLCVAERGPFSGVRPWKCGSIHARLSQRPQRSKLDLPREKRGGEKEGEGPSTVQVGPTHLARAYITEGKIRKKCDLLIMV